MSITFNDTSTEQGLVQDLRYVTGQDIGINDATRVLNYALDWYSELAIQASGMWKFDASTATGRPRATATLSTGTSTVKLDADFLTIDEVEVYYDGSYHPLTLINESSDYSSTAFSAQYSTSGKPTYYALSGNRLTLLPANDEEMTIRVWFSAALSHFAVTDTTASIKLPAATHAQHLVTYAADRVGMRTGERKERDVQIAEQKIQSFFINREMNSVPTLVPHVTISE